MSDQNTSNDSGKQSQNGDSSNAPAADPNLNRTVAKEAEIPSTKIRRLRG